jgi:hypothetical protein
VNTTESGTESNCGGNEFFNTLLVGSIVIEAVGEGVDEGLELIDAVWQIVWGVELVSPAGLAALDGSVR